MTNLIKNDQRRIIMSISRIRAIGKSPLTTVVYENIKRAIISGEIEPGTRLTEASVSKQLEVSSTPVREAFRRLESERLVHIIPYRGAVVQEFSLKEVEEVYACRRALEVLAIQLATEHMDDEGLDQLHTLIREAKNAQDITEHVKVNKDIHDIILAYAQNETLEILLTQLQDVIYHNQSRTTFSTVRKREIYDEHKRMVLAIEARDPDEAARAMYDHVNNSYQHIEEELAKH